MNKLDKHWDTLIELGASEQTLHYATDSKGYTLETLEDVLYVLFGYRNFDQL